MRDFIYTYYIRGEELGEALSPPDISEDVIKVIEAAEQCGTDCQQWRQLLEMLSARIDAMDNTYFSQPTST